MAKYDDFEQNWVQDPDLQSDPDPDRIGSESDPDLDPDRIRIRTKIFQSASKCRVSCCALMENT